MIKQKLFIIDNTTDRRLTLINSLKSGLGFGDFYTSLGSNKRLDGCLNAVVDITGIPSMLIKSRSRKRKYVIARKMFFVAAYRTTSYSLEEIGAYLDMDHATVLHSAKTIGEDYNDWREKYSYTRHWVDQLVRVFFMSVEEFISGEARVREGLLGEVIM